MIDFLKELGGASAQVLLFSAIPFVWWLITARKKESFFKWLGFKKIVHKGSAAATILMTVAVFLIYGISVTLISRSLSGEITTAGNQFAGKGISYIPAAVVYGCIRTGLSEEIIFRGFLLKRIADKFGFMTGNIIQAVLFGLMHGVPFGIVSGNILIAAAMTLLPAAVGFYMGWVNEKRCGGSILPSWIMHGVINTVVACMSL